MKRKNSDSTHYKYDMYNPRPAKRFRSRPATRSRTWGEFGKQAVGATAASGLGFIAGDFPGALYAGKKTYEYLAPDLKTEEVTQKDLIMQSYGGKFNKLPENQGSLTAITSKFASTGIVLNREMHGNITDSDCCYVGHNTFDPGFFAFGLACAIVRKVLKKAGYNSTAINEVIPFLNNTTAGPSVQFVFTYVNTDNTVGQSGTYELQANSTIEDIVNASNLGATIENLYSFTSSATVPLYYELEYAYLRTIDNPSQGKGILLSSLNLKNEMAEIYVHSTLTLQNRTASITGSADVDVNNVQPLQGFRYLFNGAIPKSKEKGNNLINAVSNQGLILTRAAELANVSYKEPPLPSQFFNIAASSKVRLAPGQMKKGIISHTYKGYLNGLLQKLYSRNNTAGTGAMRIAPGKCEMYALEEVMQSSSIYITHVGYEKETRFCFNLTTGKSPNILMNYATLEINNYQP